MCLILYFFLLTNNVFDYSSKMDQTHVHTTQNNFVALIFFLLDGHLNFSLLEHFQWISNS